ncbi:hypothetical protein FRC12_020790, partial [Ceratobasidium sp. 428]
STSSVVGSPSESNAQLFEPSWMLTLFAHTDLISKSKSSEVYRAKRPNLTQVAIKFKLGHPDSPTDDSQHLEVSRLRKVVHITKKATGCGPRALHLVKMPAQKYPSVA